MAASAAAMMFLMAPVAEARHGGWGHGHGWKRGRGGPGHYGKGKRHGMRYLRCVKKLFRAPPFMLKEKMGLNDQQIARIEKVRDNFAQKRITYKAELQRQGLKLRKLMHKDLPPEGKVLTVLRKMRSIRGTMQEERVKAGLWMLKTLTTQQRAELRKKCFRRGHHRRWGKGMGRGMGPGARSTR